jgi:hypothetical protein
MIPAHIKQGASKLERWLLNQEKYKLALKIRAYRGIANMDSDDESILSHWREYYYNRVAKIIGVEMSIISEHISDTYDFNRDWDELIEWMDNDVDYTEFNKRMERRDKYLKSLTVSDLQAMGYDCDAHLYSDDYGQEWWKFPNGERIPNWDGLSYAITLGILDEL